MDDAGSPSGGPVPPGCTAWVFFDVDDTLCDFAAMMARALDQTLVELRRRFPALVASGLDVADLQRLRDEAAATAPAGTGLVALRRAGFAAALAPVTDDPAVADAVTAFYLERRYAASIVFDDVAPALDALHARGIRAGVLTNGNSGLATLGLHDRFDLELAAESIGVSKPDPEAYAHAARRTGCEPAHLVMVGDSWVNDVEAARAAGWRAVLLDRAGTSGRPGAIASLAELGPLV